jgi:hypothetical protein
VNGLPRANVESYGVVAQVAALSLSVGAAPPRGPLAVPPGAPAEGLLLPVGLAISGTEEPVSELSW